MVTHAPVVKQILDSILLDIVCKSMKLHQSTIYLLSISPKESGFLKRLQSLSY